jgi:hypothetical protein
MASSSGAMEGQSLAEARAGVMPSGDATAKRRMKRANLFQIRFFVCNFVRTDIRMVSSDLR